jgi:hypothetical protein
MRDEIGVIGMMARCKSLRMMIAVQLVVMTGGVITPVASARGQAQPPSAAARMQQPGPEEEQLKQRSGRWAVVSTFRPAPDAAPIVTDGLIADRTMIGLYMQEIMKPGPGSKVPAFSRLAYQYFSRVEGRWQYVSLDTRFPVGIMPAFSFGKEKDGKLVLQFESLAFVGLGAEVEGRMIRSNLEISRDSSDHEFIRQYWVQSDGTGREWLAVQYEYKRLR